MNIFKRVWLKLVCKRFLKRNNADTKDLEEKIENTIVKSYTKGASIKYCVKQTYNFIECQKGA